MLKLLSNKDRNLLSISLIKVFSFVISAALFYSLAISSSYAGSTLSIDPASATVSSNFDVQVNVSTTGSSVAGFDIAVNYTGPIKYVSSKAGTLNCSPVVSTGSKSVNIACLGSLDFLKNSGSMAILTFAPNGTGAAEITITVNDTDGTIDSTSGAKFTVKEASSGGSGGAGTSGSTTSGTTGTTSTAGQLPSTAESSVHAFVIIGGSLLFIGVGFIAIFHHYDSMESIPNEVVEQSLVKKVKDNC
ncbi:LPXTG cell wall anchor domain-containing protein [Candidatus Dojkabacteria bacterium]|uniref:LPXTG cell wall anchor domain-containing protein n=1 Tax=Candidatus Dojkabacteria bacterium TaxID=2099670 RepID=A0A955I5E7_9BACT|nr:LPXTG cell wall anchor domain-containing protein [Candidatus Dojkabacteria bacterium]MCB9791058.1 LPXTG cell wall anchor domain-containing protein [Candidatus Nomurabacteria bacterium]